MAKQEQRAQTDANTYSADSFGSGCTVSASDLSAYSTCVSQEQQAATSAENDETAANAQIAQDRSQIEGTDGSLSSNIDTFVQQLGDMSWPVNIKTDVARLVNSLVKYRTDTSLEVNALTDGDDLAGNTYSARATVDDSNVQNATLVLNAALGIPAPPASSGQTT